jgi:hypothetical protein
MFFQIHKDGVAVDGKSYHSLGEASIVLQEAGQGGEVTEVDASDRTIRRYTAEECRRSVIDFRNEKRC